MAHSEEVRECEEVVAWAKGQPRDVVRKRLIRLLQENSYARELITAPSSDYGDGPDDAPNPFVSNHTGYSKPGSENFEHDTTGNQMNYSGVVDEFMNAMILHEGWQEGDDYQGSNER